MKAIVPVVVCLLLNGTSVPPNNTTYTEKDGLVIMEAENTQSDLDLWVEKIQITGFTGSSYLEFTGNSPLNGPAQSELTYDFSVNKGGLYYLHMYVAREAVVINGETRNDVANDGYVRLDGTYDEGPNTGNSHGDDAPLATLHSDTKFFGGNNNQFAWASGNRLDLGGHNNKRVAVYDLKAGHSYTFALHGRSQLFKVDRIVFRHEDVSQSAAQDTSKGETR